MDSLDLAKMLEMQRELQQKYIGKWGGLSPEKGRDMLLWMIIEAGEAADIIKKEGDAAIAGGDARGRFVEELCDTLTYLSAVALCYDITADELARAYTDKHERNMRRW